MAAERRRQYAVEKGEMFQTVWGNHCLTKQPFRKRDDNFQYLTKKMQEGTDKVEGWGI